MRAPYATTVQIWAFCGDAAVVDFLAVAGVITSAAPVPASGMPFVTNPLKVECDGE
jgi:hypothetical protein